MMMAAKATALTLGTLTMGAMATIAVADDRAATRNVQDLLDRRYEVVAEGQLVGAVDCDPQSAPITLAEIRQPRMATCFTGKVTYGSFKRLKGDDGEFVCVSFRDWACYPSQNSN
jgi:hypothetical protein